MSGLLRFFNKSGVVGTIVASMGCASCFPALGALAATLGLGFLASFEGVFINTLLPVFALLALATNIASSVSNRRWLRLVVGISGPVMVLSTLYPLWRYDWSTYLFYAGLALMLMVVIWDMVSPLANNGAGCKVPARASKL